MFDKGGTWHNTTFFNLLFTLHFPSCPPSKFFAISPPPSTVHVESLGKGIQQHVLHQETQFGASFLADSDRSCWISSGWWPVRILFSSFPETKTPCHTRGASPAFLGEWQPTNPPLPYVVLSNRIRPARHYLSNALGGQRVMRLPHLRSFPGPFTERGSEWTKFVASTWRRSLPKFVPGPFFISETLEFQQFRNKLKLRFVGLWTLKSWQLFQKNTLPLRCDSWHVCHGSFHITGICLVVPQAGTSPLYAWSIYRSHMLLL